MRFFLHRFHRLDLPLAVLLVLEVAGSSLAQDRAVGVKEKQPAGDTRAYPHMHALCIGINDYASPGIPDLSYAEADAREVAQVLKDVYGFDDVRTLLAEKASLKAINAAIADLYDPEKVGKDDAVVIYFSGHGQTVREGQKESGYLIPQDAEFNLKDVSNPAPYRRGALSMDGLRGDADGIPARHVLFLVDACYSGYLSSKSLDDAPSLANALRYSARQVITAGTAGEEAVEHNAWGHGAFTYKLLEILKTEDRPLQASKLGVMLKERVPREVAAKFGRDKRLSPQAKYLSGDGDFLFIRPGTPLVPERPDEGPLRTPVDPLAALRRGDQERISDLVSRGDYRTAVAALASYERDYGLDDFVRALKPRLEERLRPNNPPTFTNSVGMTLVLLAADAPVTFQMGGELSPEEVVRRFGGNKSHFDDEHPRHPVTISAPFYLAATEVTVGMFRQFVNATGYVTDAERGGQSFEGGKRGGYAITENGSWGWREDVSWRNPGFPQTDAHPVVLVSWNDAKAFCDWLSRKEQRSFRLPTEAEWEYACRGGTRTVFWWGDETDTTGKVANVADRRAKSRFSGWTIMEMDDGFVFTAPVGSYRPNGLGLYDLIGNAWEWCEDWYEAYPDSSATSEWFGQKCRVLRGGSWLSNPAVCPSAGRGRGRPDLRNDSVGFRVAAGTQ